MLLWGRGGWCRVGGVGVGVVRVGLEWGWSGVGWGWGGVGLKRAKAMLPEMVTFACQLA